MNNKNKIKRSDQQYISETKIQELDYNHVENLKHKSKKKSLILIQTKKRKRKERRNLMPFLEHVEGNRML